MDTSHALANADSPMNPGSFYADLWREYLSVTNEFSSKINALENKERVAFPFVMVSSMSGGRAIVPQEVATRITDTLVRYAIEKFTPEGCSSITISRTEYQYKYVDQPFRAISRTSGTSETLVQCFDPQALWDDLVASYGEEEGLNIAYQQAACAIETHFQLHNGDTVKRSKGGVLLKLPVYLDGFDLKNGDKSLTWRSQEDVASVLSNLKTFSTWAQDNTGIVDGADSFYSHLHRSYYAVVSRQSFKIGSHITLTTYNGQFTFMFSHELSEQLQIFIGLYGDITDRQN